MSSGSVQQRVTVDIRWMIRRDIPEVLRIERASFEYDWSEEDFLGCLRQRNCIGMVAERNGRVVGFMVYSLYRSRLLIRNFAVAPEFRHMGIGTQMVQRLISKLSQQRRQEIGVELRESNLIGQLFFRQAGFHAVAVMRSYFDDSSEDAYVMHYRLDGQYGALVTGRERLGQFVGHNEAAYSEDTTESEDYDVGQS